MTVITFAKCDILNLVIGKHSTLVYAVLIK